MNHKEWNEREQKAKNEFNHFVETVLVRSGRDRMFLKDSDGHEALVEDIIQFPHMHKTGTSTKTIEDLENISKMAKHMANLMRMKEDGAFARDDYIVAYDSEWKGQQCTKQR